jgi:hypothetical protein
MNETSATFIGSEVERRKWKQTEKEYKTNGITGNHKNVHLRVQTTDSVDDKCNKLQRIISFRKAFDLIRKAKGDVESCWVPV